MPENETPNSTSSAAESALLDQRVFRVTAEQYDEFVRLLEQPPRDCPGLRDLFSRKDPWDDSAPARA